jgi:hypothetical protein
MSSGGLRRLTAAVGAVIALAALAFYLYERPRVTDVAFRELLFVPPPEFFETTPLAPEGFPDCTRAMLEFLIEERETNVDVVLRPKPGVQCGIPSALESWWVDANGRRFDPPEPRPEHDERLLLMGKAGVKGGGGLETGCKMEPPVSYFIEIAGQAFEMGQIEKPECWGKGNRLWPAEVQYRDGGLETPAGWLDATIESPAVVADGLGFVLSLTNDTDEDIVMSRCPFIDIRFVADDGPVAPGNGYRTWLNCPAAPDIVEPGDTLRFHMAMPVEEDAPPGRLEIELRDEQRLLQRVTSHEIEVT